MVAQGQLPGSGNASFYQGGLGDEGIRNGLEYERRIAMIDGVRRGILRRQ